MDWWLSSDIWLTRLVLQRGVGAIYLVAFLVAAFQWKPLLGEKGLLPVANFVQGLRFMDSPSVFFWKYSDRFATTLAWLGVGLSLLTITGLSESYGLIPSMLTWFLLWALYLSFVNVGQTFYAFGWESMLLETGFLMIFLGSSDIAPPVMMIWLLRWLLFRTMLGAGLIKLRSGDPCWRNFTCLQYHYETQPMPGPFSWYFHQFPTWVHKFGVLTNHTVELVLPWLYFAPSPVSDIAGIITAGFMLWLVFSGNFSWLNWLTIVLALSCLTDPLLSMIVPLSTPEAFTAYPLWYSVMLAIVIATIIAKSVAPVLNLLSPGQIMNTSFDPFHLVNTYGAFGHITKDRPEIVFEGTRDPVIGPKTKWEEYEFKGKPGGLSRRPRQFAPYHLRLDWLLWFAAMSSVAYHPWVFTLLEKFLENDEQTVRLLARNPFTDKPPRFVRARLYLYQFTSPAERRKTGHWWKRNLMEEYLPPIGK